MRRARRLVGSMERFATTLLVPLAALAAVDAFWFANDGHSGVAWLVLSYLALVRLDVMEVRDRLDQEGAPVSEKPVKPDISVFGKPDVAVFGVWVTSPRYQLEPICVGSGASTRQLDRAVRRMERRVARLRPYLRERGASA